MGTCWALSDDMLELAQPELSGELRLVAGVLKQAVRDLRSKEAWHREDALAFFRGHRGSLSLWAEILGIEPATLQHMAGIENQSPKMREYEAPGNMSRKVVTAESEGADGPAPGVQLDLFPAGGKI
jgi:hypothetical protein